MTDAEKSFLAMCRMVDITITESGYVCESAWKIDPHLEEIGVEK